MVCGAITRETFPHIFTAGDRLPEIIGTLTGTDITGYTVEFDLERPDGTVVEKSTATTGVVITDAVNGGFKITWEASDLVAGIGQIAQVRFIDTAARPLTSQDFLIDVKAKK